MGDGLIEERQLCDLFGDLAAQTPPHLDLHCIADNFVAHKTVKVRAFLDANPRVHIHHTPTHASCATKSSCSSPSSNEGCCAVASSTRSMTSPARSLPSSTTTTAGTCRSRPTTASPYELGKSQCPAGRGCPRSPGRWPCRHFRACG